MYSQKYQILDPPLPSMSPLVTFFIIPPPVYVTRQIVTSFSLDQWPSKIILCILYNWYQGRTQRFWKGVVLYVVHHGWPIRKILDFRWSKEAKITLETISFWQNISISIFKFSSFLYAMKACEWNLINFLKFVNALITKEKMRKEKLRKVGLSFTIGCFIKSFNMIINHFFDFQAHSQPNFCLLKSGWRKKYQKGK